MRMTSLMVMSLEERWVHAQDGEQAHVILGEESFKIHFACDQRPLYNFARVLDLHSPLTIPMSIFSVRTLRWKLEA